MARLSSGDEEKCGSWNERLRVSSNRRHIYASFTGTHSLTKNAYFDLLYHPLKFCHIVSDHPIYEIFFTTEIDVIE